MLIKPHNRHLQYEVWVSIDGAVDLAHETLGLYSCDQRHLHTVVTRDVHGLVTWLTRSASINCVMATFSYPREGAVVTFAVFDPWTPDCSFPWGRWCCPAAAPWC